MRHPLRVAAILAAVVLPAVAAADTALVPLGPEFRISQAGTYYYQYTGYARTPKVATTPGGEFVVVWENVAYLPQDAGSGVAVLGRRYDADGKPKAGQFRVSPVIVDSYLVHPAVDVDPDGNFVVVWSNFDDAGRGSVFARRFDNGGTAPRPSFVVNQTEAYTDAQNQNSVALQPDGSLVVVWEAAGDNISEDFAMGRRFDAAGNPLGDDFAIAPPTNDRMAYPTVDTDASGNFVVVWQTDLGGIGGRRFAADATPAGDPFLLDDFGTVNEVAAGMSTDAAGNFVVALDDYGRRFDANGNPLGPLFSTEPYGDYGAVSSDPDGNFIVAWFGGSGAEADPVLAQRFRPDGTRDSPAAIVSEDPLFNTMGLGLPSVALDPKGDFVVVWANAYSGYGPGYGVFGRRFATCGDGVVTASLPCDDGNVAAGDGCNGSCQVETCFTCAGAPSSCTAIAGCTAVCSDAWSVVDKTTLALKHLGAPAGDESLSLRGAIAKPALAAGQYDPAVEGAEVIITGSDLVFGLMAPLAVPPGGAGSGCGPTDGWRVSRTNYTYKNSTNALPPSCAPGSARGLRVMKLKDRIARDGTIAFEVQVKHATFPAIAQAPLTATLVLGQSPAAGAAGRCARVTFPKWQFGGTSAKYGLL